MAELQQILEDLPPAERAELHREARAQGREPLEYLAELIREDLDKRRSGMRSVAEGYRFVGEEDFDLHTLTTWLERR